MIITILISGIACDHKERFNREQWMIQKDMDFPYRDQMIDDLLANHQIKGLTYRELTNLLGKPGRNWQGDSNQYFYQIVEDYGWDIDPVYTKTLLIKFQDSVVTDYQLKEWKR